MGFRGSARFRRHPPWIILCFGPRDAFSGLFAEAGAFPLWGGQSQTPRGSRPVFRRSVQGFTKSLPESAPGSFPGALHTTRTPAMVGKVSRNARKLKMMQDDLTPESDDQDVEEREGRRRERKRA